jgi:hypothetical protein
MGANFETWLKAVFDHPVSKPEWYWSGDFDVFWEQFGVGDKDTVEFMKHLFLKPSLLPNYSREQIAQGIWFLIGESSPGKSAYALFNRSIALGDRIDCILAMSNFFAEFIAANAPGKADTQSDPLHIACYMWWDILPGYRGEAIERELQHAYLDTLSAILSLSSELCRLSALHGLNHWHANYPERVQDIVDTFLDRAVNATPPVREYALTARVGAAL